MAMKVLKGKGIANFHLAITEAFKLHNMVRDACVNLENKVRIISYDNK